MFITIGSLLSQPLLLSAWWALGVLSLFLWVAFSPRRLGYHGSRTKALIILIAIALVARLVPNVILPMGAGYDIESYRLVGKAILVGTDVYTDPDAMNRHPYLPFQMYWMAFALWISRLIDFSYVKIVRLAPILADVVIAVVLFSVLERLRSRQEAFFGAILYALNPVTIYVSAYHGQFDAVPSLFLLLAVSCVQRSSLLSGIWLGLGILSKSWPVLGLPSLWREADKKHTLLIIAVILPWVGILAYLVLFDAGIYPLLSKAMGYNHGVGVWGYSYIVYLASLLIPGLARVFRWIMKYGRYVTLIALSLVWWLKARKETSTRSILTVLLAFFAFTHAFSIQYLAWLVPFAVLNCEWKWLTRFVLATFIYYLLTYTTLVLDMNITGILPWPQADWFIIRPSELPAWGVIMAWFLQRMKAPAS